MNTPYKANSYKDKLYQTIKAHTPLGQEAIMKMVEDIPVTHYKKGAILLHQGEKPTLSFFVVDGCVRQFSYDVSGKETTLEFFTDSQSINMFSFLDDDGLSRYSLECLEDSVLVTCPDCDTDEESADIQNMKYSIFAEQFTHMQTSFMSYKASSPLERYQSLVKSRPELLNRVPQTLLANFIGITPESFSRFKKRSQAK